MARFFVDGNEINISTYKDDDSYFGDLNALTETGLYLGKGSKDLNNHYPSDLGWCNISVQSWKNAVSNNVIEHRVIQVLSPDISMDTYKRFGRPVTGPTAISWSDWKKII